MKFLGLELGSWKYLQFREKNSKKYQDYFLSPGGARYTLSQMVSMGCRYVDAAQKRSLTASQLKKEEEMIQMKIKQRRESRAQQDKTFLWRVLHAKMVKEHAFDIKVVNERKRRLCNPSKLVNKRRKVS